MFESGLEKAKENIEKILETLWQNPTVTTIAFRRHGEWSAEDERVPVGALTPDGIRSTKEYARALARRIPDNASVDFFESPSFMPSGREGREIKPQRGRITASIYEKAITGELGTSESKNGEIVKDYAGNPVSSVRSEAALLGDLFESTDNERARFVSDFFALKDQLYPVDNQFWVDYEQNNLPTELTEALIKAGGSSAPELASNLTKFIEHSTTKDSVDDKHVVLAISHGETMGAFLYWINAHLRADTEEKSQLVTPELDFNEGFDVHIDGDGTATIAVNGSSVEVDWNAFKEFLEQQLVSINQPNNE